MCVGCSEQRWAQSKPLAPYYYWGQGESLREEMLFDYD